MAVNPYEPPQADHGKPAVNFGIWNRMALYAFSAVGGTALASVMWNSVLGIPQAVPTAVFCGVALVLSGACGALATNIVFSACRGQ